MQEAGKKGKTGKFLIKCVDLGVPRHRYSAVNGPPHHVLVGRARLWWTIFSCFAGNTTRQRSDFLVALARRPAQNEQRDSTRINSQIRISPIRVIASDGEQLGIIPTEEALDRAREAGLDLVEVAPTERPPVCRIMDYGKYKYDKNKKKGHGGSHNKTKEIRLRPKTGQEDINTRVRQAIKFLQHKDKVQVSVLFRGREMAHIEEGRKVMQTVIATLSEYGKVETTPQQHGRRMICMIAPR
jgi:translation initiation factor IF-3